MRLLFLSVSLPWAVGLLAQAPAPAAGPLPLVRCATPSGVAPGAGIDNPDCSFGNTNPSAAYAPTTVLRIPVVVHVIQAPSGTGFLSDTLVQSQIAVLNEDFRALAGTPGAGGQDARIEFFLATRDPLGNPTTGIRRYTNSTWFNDAGSYWNSIAWDTTRYLNVYTNQASGSLGYVPDLPQGGSVLGTPADRVVINYQAFGRFAVGGPPYDRGRTATHEVGHYLGLFHTFEGGCGSASCYTTGDRICDTAAEANPRFGCPVGATSCGSPDPIRNYMDYTDDTCMTGFSAEQVRRMRCTLASYRPNLAQPAGPLASAVLRAGAGNLNTAYTATAPRLGQNATASVLLFGTGYGAAMVFGFTGAAAVPFQGFTVLMDLNSLPVLQLPLQTAGIAAQWTYAIPNDASLAGLPIKTQALLLGSGFALTNAMDLVVGS